jgi:hypothetical protein
MSFGFIVAAFWIRIFDYSNPVAAFGFREMATCPTTKIALNLVINSEASKSFIFYKLGNI